MVKVHRFYVKTQKGIRISYPIKEEMTISEWNKMVAYINPILRGVEE